MPNETLFVISTFPDAETAERIAHQLIEAKLAACVNILPAVKSIYRWQGKVENAAETIAFFKTTTTRLPDLKAQLRASHPYDVPEIICLPIVDGLPEYLQWVRACCS